MAIEEKQLPSRASFETAYAGQAPWDIPGPQKNFVEVADCITGTVLDAGCGTGENVLFWRIRFSMPASDPRRKRPSTPRSSLL